MCYHNVSLLSKLYEMNDIFQACYSLIILPFLFFLFLLHKIFVKLIKYTALNLSKHNLKLSIPVLSCILFKHIA